MDDEDFLRLDAVLAAELGDGAAARVHEALRLNEHDLAYAAFGFRIAHLGRGDLGAQLVFPVRHTGAAS